MLGWPWSGPAGLRLSRVLAEPAFGLILRGGARWHPAAWARVGWAPGRWLRGWGLGAGWCLLRGRPLAGSLFWGEWLSWPGLFSPGCGAGAPTWVGSAGCGPGSWGLRARRRGMGKPWVGWEWWVRESGSAWWWGQYPAAGAAWRGAARRRKGSGCLSPTGGAPLRLGGRRAYGKRKLEPDGPEFSQLAGGDLWHPEAGMRPAEPPWRPSAGAWPAALPARRPR